MKKNGICYGCPIQKEYHDGCPIKNKGKARICPCIRCLVKMICTEACIDYNKVRKL